MATQRLDEALASCRDALVLDDANPFTLAATAAVLERLGAVDEAADARRAVRAMSPIP